MNEPTLYKDGSPVAELLSFKTEKMSYDHISGELVFYSPLLVTHLFGVPRQFARLPQQKELRFVADVTPEFSKWLKDNGYDFVSYDALFNKVVLGDLEIRINANYKPFEFKNVQGFVVSVGTCSSFIDDGSIDLTSLTMVCSYE